MFLMVSNTIEGSAHFGYRLQFLCKHERSRIVQEDSGCITGCKGILSRRRYVVWIVYYESIACMTMEFNKTSTITLNATWIIREFQNVVRSIILHLFKGAFVCKSCVCVVHMACAPFDHMLRQSTEIQSTNSFSWYRVFIYI